MRALASAMAEWLRERVHVAGARGIVVGLSGGIDSAVVARVAQMACPDGVMTVIMPAHSDPQDAEDARLVADAFSLPVMTVDLTEPFDAHVRRLNDAAPDVLIAPPTVLHRLAIARLDGALRLVPPAL